jgi:hypothetical protein
MEKEHLFLPGKVKATVTVDIVEFDQSTTRIYCGGVFRCYFKKKIAAEVVGVFQARRHGYHFLRASDGRQLIYRWGGKHGGFVFLPRGAQCTFYPLFEPTESMEYVEYSTTVGLDKGCLRYELIAVDYLPRNFSGKIVCGGKTGIYSTSPWRLEINVPYRSGDFIFVNTGVIEMLYDKKN